MYAQFETGTGPLLDAAAGRPGFAGGYALGRLDDDRPAVLTFWTGDQGGFEVDGDWAGHDPDEPARAAVVLWFDGPIPDPMIKAARYAGEQRIAPAIGATPGTVHGWALLDPARRAACVVNLVTSVDALDALDRTVNNTELLPGEDPALLVNPDRVETYRVLSTM